VRLVAPVPVLLSFVVGPFAMQVVTHEREATWLGGVPLPATPTLLGLTSFFA
jgi:hypothetical protein